MFSANILRRLDARSIVMASNRVLVHLKRSADQTPCKVRFIQSVVNLLNETTAKHEATVFTKVEDGNFLISSRNLHGFDGPAKLKRPEFCPISQIGKEEAEKLPKSSKERGVDTGAAILVESSDGKVLVIRRALHLRTFPGVWVPPGGHLEVGEQVWEAAFRELHEETGIKLTKDMCEDEESPVIALWESTFPPMLSLGSPVRHHIVTYLHVKLKVPHTSSSILVNPDPEEVGAATWLDRNFIQAIVNSHDNPATEIDMGSLNITEKIKILMVEKGIPNYSVDYDSVKLLQTAVEIEPDRERVSTGTVWAMKQWLEATENQS